MIDEEVNDFLSRDFKSQRQRKNSTDRCTGDQVETGCKRRVDFPLHIRYDLGGVKPAESPARQGKDLKRLGHVVRHVGQLRLALSKFECQETLYLVVYLCQDTTGSAAQIYSMFLYTYFFVRE